MVENCKCCKKEITHKLIERDFCCSHCGQYSIVYLPNGHIEIETLRIGNYYLTFFPIYKSASVVETKDGEHRIINNLSMDELTCELAEHWVKKLKTYVLFQ